MDLMWAPNLDGRMDLKLDVCSVILLGHRLDFG